MSLAACAEIVRRGDPDRFLVAMAAPPAAREKLFPIYAFNVEVARAPWVTREPLIAEMRLQWWHDVLSEIADGGPVRAHEVATPLARVLGPDAARALMPLVEARKWDIGHEGFATAEELEAHIAVSSGALAEVSVKVLGTCPAEVARDLGTAAGIAAWLRAVPALLSANRRPLASSDPQGTGLAALGLKRLANARAARSEVSPAARPALMIGWEAQTVLHRAARAPGLVLSGRLGNSEFRRRLSLLLRAASGRY